MTLCSSFILFPGHHEWSSYTLQHPSSMMFLTWKKLTMDWNSPKLWNKWTSSACECQVVCPAMGKLINIGNKYWRNGAITLTVPDHVAYKFLNWLEEKVWNDLKMQDSQALECCKQTLIGDSCPCSEDQNANRTLDRKGQTQNKNIWKMN